jgi:hypothetical protein
MGMTDRIPAAEIIAVRNYRGLRGVRILCPYCGQPELHLWPFSMREPGYVVGIFDESTRGLDPGGKHRL